MPSVFMVAEKPSLAASLANILSNEKSSTKKDSMGLVLYMNGMELSKMFPVCLK